MTKSIFKCPKCKEYTLSEKCPKCDSKAFSPQPARFSLEKERKYSHYRRKLVKREQEQITK